MKAENSGIACRPPTPTLMKWTLATALIAMCSCSAAPDQPVETGTVRWQRELDAALTASKASGKPVFALFQEVPGCAGCKQFGRDVLSDPLVVSAIESEFTPLLIHNNKGGKDAEVLKRFGEPAWNYQVVRFLDADAKDLIPRKDRVWTTGPLAGRMIAALKRAGRPVPGYLSLTAAEHSGRLKEAAFAMFCFWTGEMKLGRIEGVVTTEAGFLNGREVTLVRYDPSAAKLPDLVAAAARVECADAVYLPADDLGKLPATRLKTGRLEGYRRAPESDQKKQLSGTAAAKLDLSPAQATKVNAWIRSDRKKAQGFLTSAQREQLR
ncbi:thiol:disulfide interchange protein [Haloferula helveola]|uniref:Thiol:disulfide interchange protein n=1 Tax=Haloferula helveola TaxID=490095 RepID=A0ABN6H1X1_9BACT|nr:thiol:disulfide interchange protein [Haloferula helveola]